MSAHLFDHHSFTHMLFLQPAYAPLPSFSFAHCADPYDPLGCYGSEAGDSERPERSRHSDLTPTVKSPDDGTGSFASHLSQLFGVYWRFCVNTFSCFG